MPLTETKQPGPGAQDRPPLSESERANRYDVLSRLADDLAHEIKNPLNAMVVNLELMRRWVENGKTQPAIERAGVIEHEIRRVHLLADQLLQLQRLARAQDGPLAVDAIIESFGAAVQVVAKAARVGFDVETDTSLYAKVASEPFKFALLNLLIAAIDAEAEAGGQVALTARRAGGEVYVEVKCSKARIARDGEPARVVELLMKAAGGALESIEPGGAAGCCATLVLPQARFGTTETTGSQL